MNGFLDFNRIPATLFRQTQGVYGHYPALFFRPRLRLLSLHLEVQSHLEFVLVYV